MSVESNAFINKMRNEHEKQVLVANNFYNTKIKEAVESGNREQEALYRSIRLNMSHTNRDSNGAWALPV